MSGAVPSACGRAGRSRGGGAADLALPGWGGSGTDFGAETERFVEAAFRFPTRVVVGGADGLAFEVTPVYLPAEGTLLLSATVTGIGPSLVEEEVSIRGVVRFAKVGARFRYAVARPGSAPTPAPPSTGPGALGAGWPRLTAPVDALAVPDPGWMTGWAWSAETDGGSALVVRAVEGAGGAAAVAAPGAAALAGRPGAVVEGAAFFRPLDPGDTSVPKTDADGEPTEPAVAFQRFTNDPSAVPGSVAPPGSPPER